MYCIECGKKNKTLSKYCIECGSQLPEDKGLKQKTEDILFIPEKKTKSLNSFGIAGIILIVLAILIFIMFSSTESDDSNWEPFTSVEHGFTVDFPSYPETKSEPPVTEDGITYSYTQYVSIDGSKTFFVQAADYNISPKDFDNMIGLEESLNTILDEEGISLIDSNFTEFKGYDAIDFTYNYNENDSKYYVKGVIFIQDDLYTIKQYILMYLSPNNEDSTNYDKLINSFILD